MSRRPGSDPDAARGFRPIDDGELRKMFDRIGRARVAVIGDYCLDVYWFAEPSRGERSLETGLVTRPVRRHRRSLGGAGNVVANLVALGCGRVHPFGVVGDDPWGREMAHLLRGLGVETDDLAVQRDEWSTLAYVKPYIDGEETHRFDIGRFNCISESTCRDLLERLRGRLPDVDVVVVNQQVREGIHGEFLRRGLARLIAEAPETVFIADSRHHSEAYPGACLKINDHEAVRLRGVSIAADMPVPHDDVLAAADGLFADRGRPVVVTCGPGGLIVRDTDGFAEIPGIPVAGRIDPVGAGDSALAGLAAAMAAGRVPAVAAQLANLAAAVTIRKLNQTGTATPEEIIAAAAAGTGLAAAD